MPLGLLPERRKVRQLKIEIPLTSLGLAAASVILIILVVIKVLP